MSKYNQIIKDKVYAMQENKWTKGCGGELRNSPSKHASFQKLHTVYHYACKENAGGIFSCALNLC